jgi:fumarylpyruvate hydrolase
MNALPTIPTVTPPTLAIADSDARFPIRRVFCVGRNYGWPDARDDTAREPIFFFMKPADAVVAATGAIPYPPLTADFCHEIELVVAIGSDGADIAPGDAPAHIWGYAAGLDLTRRELQMEAKKGGRPWEGAKAFDASAPCSPLVPATRCGHPSAGAVVLSVNGVERQRADLADLIWPVADIVGAISRSVGLRAGDLIFTGTPPGVDALQPGDVVTAAIAGVGELRMTVAAR